VTDLAFCFFGVVALNGRFRQSQMDSAISPAMGSVPAESCKEFWPVRKSLSTRNRAMNGFALYLWVRFALRYRMVGVCPKAPNNRIPVGKMEKQTAPMAHKEAFSSQHSAVSENQHQNQEAFTAEDAEKSKTLPLIHGKPEQQRQQMEQHEQVKQRAEALVRRIGETCDELEKLAEENPELVGRVTSSAEEHKDAYVRLKARLQLADAAPRCRWVRQDGTSCGSPQLKKHIYCFAHVQMMEARALALSLPAPEDANAIQIGIMRIQKALIEGTISTKTAGLLLYSMQLALQNVGQTTFGQAKTEELVRETVSEKEAFSKNRKPLTTKDTKDTEEEQGLPGMDADERGLESGIKPVEWRPTPDMYRTDTPEGREAYEASFRMTMAPRVGAERRPPQPVIPPQPAQKRRGPVTPVIAPEDCSETHAVLG
jgi:hypothetical protein